MAWSTAKGAYHPTSLIKPANVDHHHMLLKYDDALLDPRMLLKEPTPYWHSSPLAFLPFLRDADKTLPAGGRSTAGFCGDVMQAMKTKRPMYRPFVDIVEGVKGSSLSPDHSTVHEHSACTSEFYNNVSTSTAMMEKMLRSSNEQYSNEEVELHMNEGESRMRKKRRLTGEQVRTLEGSFEADKKLEAERKQQLAQRLGLEPRQVAVWFQNRRARSKAKHLEHDFVLLKSKYYYMLAETQKLRSEVSRLTAELEATKGGGEVAGAKQGEPLGIQGAPIAPVQSTHRSNHFSIKDVKSISTMEAEQLVNQDSHLLNGNGAADCAVLLNSINQHMSSACASPSTLSCSPESSVPDNFVEVKSSGCNSSPACVSTEGDEEYNMLEHVPCSELLACFSTEGNMNTSSNPSFMPHLNKRVSDMHHLLQAYLHSDDCLMQPSGSRSHHVQAFDCIWELTT